MPTPFRNRPMSWNWVSPATAARSARVTCPVSVAHHLDDRIEQRPVARCDRNARAAIPIAPGELGERPHEQFAPPELIGMPVVQRVVQCHESPDQVTVLQHVPAEPGQLADT